MGEGLDNWGKIIYHYLKSVGVGKEQTTCQG
jgi:hypothetical protein